LRTFRDSENEPEPASPHIPKRFHETPRFGAWREGVLSWGTFRAGERLYEKAEDIVTAALER